MIRSTGRELPTPAEMKRILESDALLYDAPVLAVAFEVSLDGWYAMVRQGTAPVMPIRVGRRQKYRASDVRRVLGLDPVSAAAGAP